MKIIWSPLAIARASEIAEYISLDNPTAATKWINDIFEKVLILKSSPKIGLTVPEINRKEISRKQRDRRTEYIEIHDVRRTLDGVLV